MLAKRRRAHIGPAAKGAGEAARIEKTEFESDAPEIQAVLLNQLDCQLHAHLIQQLLVGGTGFAQLASQVTRTDVERLGDQFFGNVLLRQQHANALLDLFGKVHIGRSSSMSSREASSRLSRKASLSGRRDCRARRLMRMDTRLLPKRTRAPRMSSHCRRVSFSRFRRTSVIRGRVSLPSSRQDATQRATNASICSGWAAPLGSK